MATPNQFVLRTTSGQEYLITDLVKIGREESNGIPLDDPSASRHHASLWVEGGNLYIRDEKSANGVFVNNKLIPNAQPRALRSGDRIRIGQTELLVAVIRSTAAGTVILPATPSARRGPILACGIVLLLGLAVLCIVPMAGYYFFGWRVPQLSALLTPGGGPPPTRINVNTLRISTPLPPETAGQYAAKGHGLAQYIATLNEAELQFIKHAHENPSSRLVVFGLLALPNVTTQSTLDSDLAQIAASALTVCISAEDLGRAAAVQDSASPTAAFVASHYVSVSQLTCALVIDSQNIRVSLSNASLTPADASKTIADYGARLWASSGADSTIVNPFTQSLSSTAGIPSAQFVPADEINSLLGTSNSLAWLAVSAGQETRTLNLPATSLSVPPVDRNDTALQATLTTAEGQSSNAPAAIQMAGAIINAGSSVVSTSNRPASNGQVSATFFSAAAAASSSQTPNQPNSLPAFPGGQANALTQDANGDPLSSLLGLGADNQPALQSQSPVKDLPAAVSLTIANIVVKQVESQTGFTEAKVTLEFDVTWQSTLASPQFNVSCNSDTPGAVTTASGSQHRSVSYNLILYPGNAFINCSAGDWGRPLGSVEAVVLVGDPADATRRAERVETEYFGSGLTLTAQNDNIQGTQTSQAAATQSVLQTQNALSTEVIGTQTAEFIATITEIARQTERAPTPGPTDTPLPTATFVPILVDTFFHAGDAFAVGSNIVTKPGHLYRVCLSGIVNLTTGPARPSDIDHVNGLAIPASGCLIIEGDGKAISVTCGTGEAAADPGGFTVQVYDLGPS